MKLYFEFDCLELFSAIFAPLNRKIVPAPMDAQPPFFVRFA